MLPGRPKSISLIFFLLKVKAKFPKSVILLIKQKGISLIFFLSKVKAKILKISYTTDKTKSMSLIFFLLKLKSKFLHQFTTDKTKGIFTLLCKSDDPSMASGSNK